MTDQVENPLSKEIFEKGLFVIFAEWIAIQDLLSASKLIRLAEVQLVD
jgi:hypothetical protein